MSRLSEDALSKGKTLKTERYIINTLVNGMGHLWKCDTLENGMGRFPKDSTEISVTPCGSIWIGWGLTSMASDQESGPGSDQNMTKSGVDRVKMRWFSLVWTKIAIWPSWERTHVRVSSLKIGTCSLGLGWCIEWLGDWLNLLRLEYADPNLESWTSDTSHVFVWVLDGPSTVVEVAKHARASAYTLKHKEKQRKGGELDGFNIQDEEWFEGHKENPPGPENTRKGSRKKRDGRIPLPMAKTTLRGEVHGKAVSWELGTTMREGRRPYSTLNGMNSLEGGCSVESGFMGVQWKGLLVRPMERSYQYWKPSKTRPLKTIYCDVNGGTEPGPWPVQEVIVLGHRLD
ncbi:hypothetical protein DY000_02052128 [Brassica cretica]|uniref:DUF4283 domain-containing protein n=1 Tax=Brassica cretica TaxID=69181 RepID=A0ABQ7A747_BRACR|nr:hypothetical protein DY000_02052128 [Brassica cretica]